MMLWICGETRSTRVLRFREDLLLAKPSVRHFRGLPHGWQLSGRETHLPTLPEYHTGRRMQELFRFFFRANKRRLLCIFPKSKKPGVAFRASFPEACSLLAGGKSESPQRER